MKDINVELMPHLTHDVVEGITKFQLDSYLIALEGWRRGLKLTWHKDETGLCKMHRAGGSTSGKFFTLKSETREHDFFRSRGDLVSNKTVTICQRKEETKDLLAKSDVPIPKGEIFNREDNNEMLDYAAKIGFPIIIKPTSGSMGRGVYTNLNSLDELTSALEDFKKRYKYKSIILEKHYYGEEYRIYVVGDKVIGATNRVPANVQGDGERTVRELIENKNEMRKSNPYLAPKPMKIDYEIKNALKNNGLSLDSVLPKNEILSLREKSNLSTGGDPLEATDELTKEVRQIAVNALKALPSIPHAGVDIIVDPEDNTKGVVLEANATAEIAFHMFPWAGNPKDVPEAIIDYYFPETRNSQKSLSYFDYKSILAPLNTWAADSLTVSPAPQEKLYGKQYNVTGNVQKVGYMNYIRRQALKKGLYGHSLKRGPEEIEILLIGTDQNELDDFIDICYKGSKKSKVDYVKEKDINVENKPFKIGFEVIAE